MTQYDSNFEFNCITVNRNVECKPHRDKYNRGKSYLLFLGDFTGGELCLEDGRVFSETKKIFTFDNKKVIHWNNPILSGVKFSMIFFWDNRIQKGID